jgi:hypothetical protein
MDGRLRPPVFLLFEAITMKLVALKPLTYNTRRLLPGDSFEARKPSDARVLIAVKKARAAQSRPTTSVPPPPRHVAEKIAQSVGQTRESDDELTLLRNRAKELGVEIDGRWGTARLRIEIEAVRSKG